MRAGGRHFRPCGRDVVEFFNSTVWALYGQMEGSIRKYWADSSGMISDELFWPIFRIADY